MQGPRGCVIMRVNEKGAPVSAVFTNHSNPVEATNRAAAGIKNALKSYLFDGVALVILGVILLLLPQVSLKVLCIAIGVGLIVMGLIKLIFFAANANGERRIVDIPIGIVQLVLGFALIIESAFFISLFQIVVGVILIYGSLLMLIHAFNLRYVRGVMFVLSIIFGLLTLAAGVIIVLNPVEFADFMMQLMGVALIVEGLALIVVMHTMKRGVDKVQAEMNDREIVVSPQRVESVGYGRTATAKGSGAGGQAGRDRVWRQGFRDDDAGEDWATRDARGGEDRAYDDVYAETRRLGSRGGDRGRTDYYGR